MIRQSSNQFVGVLKSRRVGKRSPTPAEIANGVPGSGNQFDVPSQKSCAERETAVMATTAAQPSQKKPV